MERRRMSHIWRFYTVVDPIYAKCTVCDKQLSYKASVTNMKRHFLKQHYDVYHMKYLQRKKAGKISQNDRIKIEEDDDDDEEEMAIDEVYPPDTIFPKPKRKKLAKTEPKCDLNYPKPNTVGEYCTFLDKDFVKCNICEATLSYRTSITNIKKHLVRKHGFYYPKCNIETLTAKRSQQKDELETEPTESLNPTEEASQDDTYQRNITVEELNKETDCKLLTLLIKDFQPFTIVEESGFRSFMNSLNPSYPIPNKETLIKNLTCTYDKCRNILKKHVLTVKNCCVTTEYWTSAINENYVSVSVHYINEHFKIKSVMLDNVPVYDPRDISEELKRITKEWGIDTKISVVVTDTDRNILSAIADLEWNHIVCFAHILDSLAQESTASIEALMDKVTSILRFLQSNTEAKSQLDTLWKTAKPNAKRKKLIEEDSMWMSQLRLLERFLTLEGVIKQTLVSYEDVVSQLDEEEWTVLKEFCQVLKPFETIAYFINSDQYMYASLIIVLTKELDDALDEMLQNNLSEPIMELLVKLKNNLAQHLGSAEMIETLALCTYLDPRFKNLGFSSPETADATKDHLIDLLSNRLSEQRSLNAQNKSQPTAKTESSFSIWQSFKRRVSECKQSGTSKSKCIIEVERYLEDELADQRKDPLDWWREFRGVYPCMSAMAQEVMCAVGTSIPSSRLFSKDGRCLTMQRSCLDRDGMRMLTFLNGNWDMFRRKTFDEHYLAD